MIKDISGLTALQALDKIYRETGEAAPADFVEAVHQLAKDCDGVLPPGSFYGKGTDADLAQAMVGASYTSIEKTPAPAKDSFSLSDLIGLLGSVMGAEEKPDSVDDETTEDFNERFPTSPEGQAMFARAVELTDGRVSAWPTYNGVVGDSCRCCTCNLRRATVGNNYTDDADRGMSPEASKAAVAAGYKAEGKTPPKSTPQENFDRLKAVLEAAMGRGQPTVH